MEEWVIAELVGAASENLEWAVFFLGETDERALTIWVNNLYVPTTQIRGRGHVRIPDDYRLPDAIAPEVVGIVHLHPGTYRDTWVKFSSVDTGPGGLNERWPMSMVVGLMASVENFDEAYSMGISYEIRGKCVLPCGALGLIDYFLHPSMDGMPDPNWPWPKGVIEPTVVKTAPDDQDESVVGVKHAYLEDCSRYVEAKGSTRYELKRTATCGLVETETWPRPYVFGIAGEGILHALPKAYSEPQARKGKGKHRDNGRTYVERHYLDRCTQEVRGLLPGWSEASDY